MNKKIKAIAIREVRLAQPNKQIEERAIAAFSQMISHSELLKQSDLLHIEAVLVSEGINDNDDAFTRDELKKALSSPILKPINWQHNDEKILGAMYGVEARDFNGNVLSEINDESVELVVQGVVWHYLPHIKATADEIINRIKTKNLYVSMECWFNNYDYGLYTQSGELYDVITRNNETAFLDGYLRVNGGTGKYNNLRIGRALSDIIFGGVAFVDRPANKRSFILNQFVFDPNEMYGVNNNVVNSNLEVKMTNLDRTAASADQIQDAVLRALSADKKAAEAERVKADLENARTKVVTLETNLAKEKDSLAKLRTYVDKAFNEAKAVSTAPEIAEIDRALNTQGDGDAVWNAKLSWLAKTSAEAKQALANSANANINEKLVEENALLKKELASLKNDIRKAEIEYLFKDVLEMNDQETEVFVKAGLSLQDDASYTAWLDEKKLFAKKMLDLKNKKDKKDDSEDCEAGLLAPKDGATLLPKQAALKSQWGKVPSNVAGTPRSKLSASADLDAMFEEVKEPNLAGASTNQDTDVSNPMTKLVASLLNKSSKDN